jgi:hypothetical protein
VTNVETTYYLLGSALGPHPYPLMVQRFSIGDRQRIARADFEQTGIVCPTRSSPASAAAQTRLVYFIRFCRTKRCG